MSGWTSGPDLDMDSDSSDFDRELIGLDLSKVSKATPLSKGDVAVNTPTTTISSSLSSNSTRSSSGSGKHVQRTLFGERLPSSPPQDETLDRTAFNFEDHKIQHEINTRSTISYWYPSNFEQRNYQLNIVKQSLFQNVLCALPTGAGKTFIASTVMLNWYRWTTTAKIIFMAPTRPLVSQQIEACLGITGIPRHDTSVLMGTISPREREEEWNTKRVFFATPQTVKNDLEKGILDPKTIVCTVFDEAHRSTGASAYAEVVKAIVKENTSFRVLALTATPSSKIEGVQEVMDNLLISKAEIRSEDSLDMRPYIQKKEINQVMVDYTDKQSEILDCIVAGIKPYLDKLYQANLLFNKDPSEVTQFALLQAMKKYQATRRGGGGSSRDGSIIGSIRPLMSISHCMKLLKIHGVRSFYEKIKGLEAEKSKWFRDIMGSDSFRRAMSLAKEVVDKDELGHAKLEKMVEIVGEFFDNEDTNGKGSRAIIFCEYRDPAGEILRVLKQWCPSCRPSLFIGQSSKLGTDKDKRQKGMTQKEQQKAIEDFRNGTLNVLVATSIGEEGLDIGEVDLIICYDHSSSPIRALQRMGRTGRKRAGTVYMLMSKGEDHKVEHAHNGYKYIQDAINNDTHQRFTYALSDRILPETIKPYCERKIIEIPKENDDVIRAADVIDALSQDRRKKRPKRSSETTKQKKKKKTFELPPGAVTGFVSASSLLPQDKVEKQVDFSSPDIVDLVSD